MKRLLLSVLTLLLAAPVWLAADRMSDKDVKTLIERIDQERGKFVDALDGKLKDGVLRGPTGEVNVSKFLDDFKTAIGNLKDRLKPGYSASSEAGVVLQQGTKIDVFFKQQPPGTKGGSEWTRLGDDLKLLAGAYSAEFPLAENAAVRRMGDAELATVAETAAKNADTLKKALETDLKPDKSIDSATRQNIGKEAEGLSKDAKAVASKLRDSQPTSSEVEKLLTGAARMQAFIGSHNVPTAAATWKELSTNLGMLAGGYGAKWPR